ncbi:MAG: hypothetical protein JSR78_09220, partial [Proteobacteria bacterium]|nr:hypothetical protein [Pseudomonadota bacterium]
SPTHAPILDAILSDASYEDFVDTVSHLAKNTKFELSALDAVLIRAALDHTRMNALRDAATKSRSGDRLLLATLQVDREDLDWLCRHETLGTSRKAHLLVGLFNQADDRRLHHALRETDLAERILHILAGHDRQFTLQQARILVGAQLSLGCLVERSGSIIEDLPPNYAHRLAEVTLARMLNEPHAGLENKIDHISQTLAGYVTPRWLILHAAAPGLPASQLKENIWALRHQLKHQKILEHVEELSELLAQRHASDLSTQTIKIWADMINQVGKSELRGPLHAAELALRYAFDNLFAPLSELVVVSFPVVYRSLSDGNVSPASMMRFFFPDWDRRKVARQHLVRAFAMSQWPPADLVAASFGTGDTQRILRRAYRELGNEYFARIAKDVERLPAALASRVISELEEAEKRDF